jgi:hypothetical protein
VHFSTAPRMILFDRFDSILVLLNQTPVFGIQLCHTNRDPTGREKGTRGDGHNGTPTKSLSLSFSNSRFVGTSTRSCAHFRPSSPIELLRPSAMSSAFHATPSPPSVPSTHHNEGLCPSWLRSTRRNEGVLSSSVPFDPT